MRLIHYGWGTPFAVAIAVLVVGWGPGLAQRLRWRPLVGATWLVTLAWTMALALIDGWRRGFSARLTDSGDYLHEVPRFADIATALHAFARRIPDYQPDSWTTQVSGHPPGAVLTFVGLDRIGLGGGVWGAVVCTAVGTSAVAAVLITLRTLGDEDMARVALRFLRWRPRRSGSRSQPTRSTPVSWPGGSRCSP